MSQVSEEKQKYERYEIGEAYCTYMHALMYCEVKLLQLDPAISTYAYQFKLAKNNLSRDLGMPIFIRYLGNDLFEEMETGKIFTIPEEQVAYDQYIIKNPVNYQEVLLTLNRICRYPIIINPEWIGDIVEEIDFEYYSINRGQQVVPLEVDKFEEYAKAMLWASLGQIAWLEYNYHREQLPQKIKQFKDRPLPNIEESK